VGGKRRINKGQKKRKDSELTGKRGQSPGAVQCRAVCVGLTYSRRPVFRQWGEGNQEEPEDGGKMRRGKGGSVSNAQARADDAARGGEKL